MSAVYNTSSSTSSGGSSSRGHCYRLGTCPRKIACVDKATRILFMLYVFALLYTSADDHRAPPRLVAVGALAAAAAVERQRGGTISAAASTRLYSYLLLPRATRKIVSQTRIAAYTYTYIL
uniref:Uncharacterized protein n=1 Tax=Trichogramma kaykai TaxID=54128 RepID=A0ABD2W159_9HYME